MPELLRIYHIFVCHFKLIRPKISAIHIVAATRMANKHCTNELCEELRGVILRHFGRSDYDIGARNPENLSGVF